MAVCKPHERGWWSTGNRALNYLLTRDEGHGFALPSDGRSSIAVIRGPVGAGKSALAALIACRLNPCPETDEGSPLPIYLSFDHPARGVADYIERILGQSDSAALPLILSPRQPRRILQEGGIGSLRRLLADFLTRLKPNSFAPESTPGPSGSFLDWIESSPDWSPANQEMIGNVRRSRGRKGAALAPVMFLDPINFFFEYRDSRAVVSELFETFRTTGIALITTLEDTAAAGDQAHRQLASDVEFEADVAITLEVLSKSHIRRTISVIKNRQSSSVYGPHAYRIEDPQHSLSNLLSGKPHEHTGFLIFSSIHNILSRSWERAETTTYHRSGIGGFDAMLRSPSGSENNLLPEDAVILVNGEKGTHKLSLAFNLLVGGVCCASDKDQSAMLISFGDETSIQVPKIALAWGKEEGFNNSYYIDSFKPLHSEGKKDQGGFKALIHGWESTRRSKPSKAQLFWEVLLKPGHLHPEEFLWIVEALFDQYKPSRMLIENTAHLHSRFPELDAEPMLFTALSAIAHKRKAMLIITDVEGEGADKRLSRGLAALAHYVATLSPPSAPLEECNNALSKFLEQPATANTSVTFADLRLRNVRGKNYNGASRLLTVARVEGRSRLILLPQTR